MRYRLMATYRGAPYEAGIGPTDRDVVLFAACPPPEELRFEPATGHWRKQLRIEEVQALWESRPVGLFRGEPCMVLDDLDDRLHIAYLGHDAYLAEGLGYWQVDRGVFELITPREEVTNIIEQRRDYDYRPRTAAESRVPAGPGNGALSAAGPLPGPGFTSGPAAGPALVPSPAPTPARTQDSGTGNGPLPGYLRQSDGNGPQPGYLRDTDGTGPQPGYLRESDGAGVLLPPAQTAPLPLEAAALRAATAATAASRGRLQPGVPAGDLSGQAADPLQGSGAPPWHKRAGRRRQATQQNFAELASRAAIPPSSYAIGAQIDGAMCLVQTNSGFEVFSAAAGARHEVRLFADEESAYFYLFGVLAAEAVRTGVLGPRG
jgi:hypothetical protein